jgi:hypothetical protein
VRAVSLEDAKEVARIQSLTPPEEAFKGKRGYQRKYDKNGRYKWRYRYKSNENGKLTREGAEVQEMLMPSLRASSERQAKHKAPVVALKDQGGQVHYVDPALAEGAARQNGWSHRWRAGGESVESGVDGMLWRWLRHKKEWEPTGRYEAGILGRTVECKGIQRDPDGHPWRGLEGRWVRI